METRPGRRKCSVKTSTGIYEILDRCGGCVEGWDSEIEGRRFGVSLVTTFPGLSYGHPRSYRRGCRLPLSFPLRASKPNAGGRLSPLLSTRSCRSFRPRGARADSRDG